MQARWNWIVFWLLDSGTVMVVLGSDRSLWHCALRRRRVHMDAHAFPWQHGIALFDFILGVAGRPRDSDKLHATVREYRRTGHGEQHSTTEQRERRETRAGASRAKRERERERDEREREPNGSRTDPLLLSRCDTNTVVNRRCWHHRHRHRVHPAAPGQRVALRAARSGADRDAAHDDETREPSAQLVQRGAVSALHAGCGPRH